MSVAASESLPSPAVSRIPARICTDIRDETPLDTSASFWTSSSREQVSFMPEPVTTSVLII